jgi:hypothetical protein
MQGRPPPTPPRQRSARGKPDGGVCPATGGHPAPKLKSAGYIGRSRARMTVLADHGAPLGVSTWRAFNSAATARADLSVKWEQFRLAASYVDRILRGPEPRGKCQNCQTEDYPQG